MIYSSKEDCCGCSACKSICKVDAIIMLPDNEGFFYPKVNKEKCVKCGECVNICPNKIKKINEKNLSEKIVYAVYNRDEKVRKKSTSGGVYTLISDYFLERGGIVSGVKYNKNFVVEHNFATTKIDRNKFLKSKYVQSDLKNSYIEICELLSKGKNVLFSGTGCQVAGLKRILDARNISKLNLLTNDIICHGVPSPKLWKEYLSLIQKKYILKSIDFRCKEKGWHGYNVKIEFENSKVKINSPSSKIYTNLFKSDLILRPSCYKCKYASINRVSDIMIGDYWGIEKVIPELNDNKGVSLVILSTEKGKRVFSEIKKNSYLWESNIYDCLQPNLIKATNRPFLRDIFWEDYYKYGFLYIAKKYARYNIKYIVRDFIKDKYYNLVKRDYR